MVTDETPSTTRERHRTPGWRSAAHWLYREVDLARRMIADNLLVASVPPVLFAVAAGAHYNLSAEARLAGIGKAVVLGLLFNYVFDATNQAQDSMEDVYNKPYRPIPAGLATADGLMRRFWLAVPVYTLLGWILGAWLWVLLWQIATFLAYRWGAARYYLWWKSPFNIAGSVTSLAAGWQVTAPLDSTAWTWIVTISLYFPLALIYEDVRDMEGDHAIGRRTWALVIGPTFVRRWFATFMALLPCTFYAVLAHLSGAPGWKGIVWAVAIAIPSWTCATRALTRHSVSADRLTFQLFYVVWGITVGTAPLLVAGA